MEQAVLGGAGNPIHRTSEKGQLLVFGLGRDAISSAVLGLDGLPQGRGFDPGKGMPEAWVEPESSRNIGF